MKLTRKEQEMLDGKRGDAVQKAMEILVAVGECYDAEKFVPINSVHLAPANPVNSGKGGVRFVKDMAKRGGIFVVPATSNPESVDPEVWQEMGFSEELYQEQKGLSEAFAKMGAYVCGTCTPYIIGHVPRMGEHVAWCESSAIVYVNSVLGGRTNREGGPSSLASGLTGRTPAHGYHLDEHRSGKLKIMIDADLKGVTDYSTLGYFAGKIAQDRVPVFTGMPPSVTLHELKYLSAALATSGSVALYHAVGVTPEAPTEEAACGHKKIRSSDIFNFGTRELKETEDSLSGARPEEANLVVLGCPHASIEHLRTYAMTLSGRKAKDTVEIWILIPSTIKGYAERMGYAKIFASAGVRLLSNTCPLLMPADYFKRQGFSVMATDSSKLASYIPNARNVTCCYGSLDTFVDAVTNPA